VIFQEATIRSSRPSWNYPTAHHMVVSFMAYYRTLMSSDSFRCDSVALLYAEGKQVRLKNDPGRTGTCTGRVTSTIYASSGVDVTGSLEPGLAERLSSRLPWRFCATNRSMSLRRKRTLRPSRTKGIFFLQTQCRSVHDANRRYAAASSTVIKVLLSSFMFLPLGQPRLSSLNLIRFRISSCGH
jgi:hypothetical protein